MFQPFADNADRLGCAGMMSSGLLLTLAIVYVAGGSCGCCLRNGAMGYLSQVMAILTRKIMMPWFWGILVSGKPKSFFPLVDEALQTPQP